MWRGPLGLWGSLAPRHSPNNPPANSPSHQAAPQPPRRLTAVASYTATGTLTKRVAYAYDVFDRRIGKDIDADGDGNFDSGERFVYDGQHIALAFDAGGSGGDYSPYDSGGYQPYDPPPSGGTGEPEETFPVAYIGDGGYELTDPDQIINGPLPRPIVPPIARPPLVPNEPEVPPGWPFSDPDDPSDPNRMGDFPGHFDPGNFEELIGPFFEDPELRPKDRGGANFGAKGAEAAAQSSNRVVEE